jgi:drug/metabolite transporter (DMT)-like permease
VVLQAAEARRSPEREAMHACGILVVLVAGARVLCERAGWRDLAGAAAIVVGVGMLAWGAPRGSEVAISDTALGAVAGALAIAALVPSLLGRRCGRLTLMICAGLGFAGANMAVKGISEHIATHTYLAAGWYLAIAGVGATLGVLNQMSAFQRHRAVEVVPVTFALPIFLPIVLSLGVLREHWAAAALAGAPFAIGGALLLAGRAAIARAAPVTRIVRAAAGCARPSPA